MVAAKVCMTCGKDCSRGRRVKDEAGRYSCGRCYDAALAARAEIDLAPLDNSRTQRAPCPRCGGAMEFGEPMCAGCGFDSVSVPLEPARAREALGDYDIDPASPPLAKEPGKKKREGVFTCKGCGYNLKGLKRDRTGEMTCPECGVLDRPLSRGEYDDEVSRDVAREAYRQPIIMLAAGVMGLLAVLTAKGWIVGGIQGAVSGPMVAGGGVQRALLMLAVGFGTLVWSTIVAIGVTLLAGVMWTGTSTTLRLLALQVVGLQAAGWCLYHALSLIPLPIPWWSIAALCGLLYAWYLSDMQDLYFQDAALITFLTVVVLSLTLLAAYAVF